MRVVRNEKDLESSINLTRAEAKSALIMIWFTWKNSLKTHVILKFKSWLMAKAMRFTWLSVTVQCNVATKSG